LQTAREDFAGGIQASLRRWYDGTEVPDEEIRLTEKTLSGNDIDSYLNCYRVFATADAEVAPALAGITAPTLAITGSDDPGSTPEMSRRLAAAIPDCDVRILDDTRHMLPVQRPGEFTDALTAFLKEH
jgi:pimeloyl-ACP methyl ester carboxylesterase